MSVKMLANVRHIFANDGTDGDGSDRLGEGDHLKGSRATACVVLNRDVCLLRCIVDGDVHEHGQRNEEKPSDDGT